MLLDYELCVREGFLEQEECIVEWRNKGQSFSVEGHIFHDGLLNTASYFN